jgi:hypothetical protein
MTNARIHIQAADPNAGDVEIRIEYPFSTAAGMPQPTDAQMVDLGQRIVASDYIQNQSWGATAVLDWISAPASDRGIYPTP